MGRPKNIESPEQLEEYFKEYCIEAKSKPILKHDFVGKDGKSVYRELEPPLTVDGFEVWCYRNGIITDLGDYFQNTDKRYTDYGPICRMIRKIVREDQIKGGMAGIYNPSITQRLNNLVEKTETVITEQPLFPDEKESKPE